LEWQARQREKLKRDTSESDGVGESQVVKKNRRREAGEEEKGAGEKQLRK
jgi:hypothetical protein